MERAPPEREVAGSIPARRISGLTHNRLRLFKRSGVSGRPSKVRPVQTRVLPGFRLVFVAKDGVDRLPYLAADDALLAGVQFRALEPLDQLLVARRLGVEGA